MKKLRNLSLVIVLTLLISAGNLCTEERETFALASVDLMSNYVWRGQKLSKSLVVQPSVAIIYGAFGTNIWANYDSDSKELTETDLTLSYSYAINKFILSAGYIYYAMDSTNDTQEFYGSASFATWLKPTLTVYYDFDEGNGAFIMALIGHSLEVSKDIALNIGASVSYNINNKVMGFNKSNFYNGELSASLGIPLIKGLILSPKIAFSFPLSNDAEDAIKKISGSKDTNIFYGGLNISLSF